MLIKLILTILLSFNAIEAKQLNMIMFSGASVLPLFKKHSEIYVVLGREAYGKDRGKWDAWGGSRNKGEWDPAMTASREFYEEAIVEKTLKWGRSMTFDWVSIDYAPTQNVLAKKISKEKYYVMFLTMFSEADIRKLRHRFFKARKEAKAYRYREKNSLAIVRLDDLLSVIYHSKSNHDLKAPAFKVQVSNGHISSHHSHISLRPILVKVLRPYVEKHKYTEGNDPRVRYYQ